MGQAALMARRISLHCWMTHKRRFTNPLRAHCAPIARARGRGRRGTQKYRNSAEASFPLLIYPLSAALKPSATWPSILSALRRDRMCLRDQTALYPMVRPRARRARSVFIAPSKIRYRHRMCRIVGTSKCAAWSSMTDRIAVRRYPPCSAIHFS